MKGIWIQKSPFCCLATNGAEGRVDVGPHGDPPGSFKVIDEKIQVPRFLERVEDLQAGTPEVPVIARDDDQATTMDHDPLAKKWYLKGTGDGTGKPKLWVQS